jgi:hypothetical protein
MSEPPRKPWIQFPDLLRTPKKSAQGERQLHDWMNFLFELSPDGLRKYQVENPAPPGWDEIYKFVIRLVDQASNEGEPPLAYPDDLIRKLWQSTTLK